MRKSGELCLLSMVMLLIGACGGGESTSSLSVERQVYRPSSEFAEALMRCTRPASIDDSCPLQELPFIGDGTVTPSIEGILDRVVVDAQWMGQRFESIFSIEDI